jgi:acetyl-CoA carboxylase biotin carboxyl carrier protein
MNLKEIRELIEVLKDTEVSELELERAGTRIRIRMGGPHGYVVEAAQPAPQAAAPREEAPSAPSSPAAGQEQAEAEAHPTNVVVVTSPIVGTFYRSPSPDAPSYVEVGDMVKKGQVICIIEAMKLMNEIEAETSGKVVKILADNAQPVEYGEPLFHIEPA